MCWPCFPSFFDFLLFPCALTSCQLLPTLASLSSASALHGRQAARVARSLFQECLSVVTGFLEWLWSMYPVLPQGVPHRRFSPHSHSANLPSDSPLSSACSSLFYVPHSPKSPGIYFKLTSFPQYMAQSLFYEHHKQRFCLQISHQSGGRLGQVKDLVEQSLQTRLINSVLMLLTLL